MDIPQQQQNWPGSLTKLDPPADHGEKSYEGHGRLAGKRALVTGGDSGIGRAVAIAYAREGADVAIAYYDEHEDAESTAQLIREAGRRVVLLPGDLSKPQHCRDVVARTVDELGGLDVLVSNAAFQMARQSILDVPDDEWDFTIATNLSAFFHLVKAAVPHLKAGSAIIGSTSVNSDTPPPVLLAYNATKAGIANMVGSLSQELAPKGIRVNSVAPGPIWTPLIPATMAPDMVENFGSEYPIGRAGQPGELAPVYVMLASDEASYVSGARVAVTGGQPIL
ncbi:SDR family oxidoreductase [Kocuria sp.]|uniref:SDR family oxidoreductase n=1 Tax=Kocuria sp. TaxID=1871328 RepID=UPI0026DC157F|nr:SDR family oxidoreductase [Kocuria sp.]MDO4919604.1 SDR family oxidoreductase [Kocuria sp.]